MLSSYCGTLRFTCIVASLFCGNVELNRATTKRNSRQWVHPRDYPVFRPHWDERPEKLLQQRFASEEELDWVRIAKHGQTVIAAYRVSTIDRFNFSIASIAVLPDYRGKGIGRWMLMHAMGLIESKGGRTVHANWGCSVPLLDRLGFVHDHENNHWLHLERE